MASSSVDIKIRALIEGLDGIAKLAQQITAVQGNLNGMAASAASATSGASHLGAAASTASSPMASAAAAAEALNNKAKEMGKGLQDLRGQLGGVGEGFDKLVGYVKAATLAYVGFLAVQGTKELADYAARTQTLGVTLSVVASNAGYSKEQISSFEGELRKLGITQQAARESMTAMIQAGIPLERQSGQTASNVARLARAAQDLAVVTGENSSDTLRRLTTNIQQMDTMGLRFMGLSVNIEQAQEKYAASIGKTADALTQQQKVLAVNNAVLDEAVKLQGAYEASMETVGKKVSSLKRYQEELADAIGKHLLPAYGAVVDSATNLLKSLEQIASGTDKNGEASKRFAEVISQLGNGISDVIVLFAKFVSENIDLFESIGSNIAGMISDLVQLGRAMAGTAEEAGVWKAALWSAGLVIAGVRDGLRVLQAIALEVNAAFSDVVGDILKGLGTLAQAAGFKELGAGLLSTATAFHEVAKASSDSSAAIIADFAAGRTATQDFINGVKEIRPVLSDFGKASTFKEVAEELASLSGMATDSAKGLEEFTKASDLAAEDVLKLAKSGKLSKDELGALLKAAEEAGVKMPEDFKTVEQAMSKMAKEAESADKIMSRIGKGTSFKQVEEELNSVIRAQAAGIITSTQAGQAFDTLSKSVNGLKESGAASGKEMAALYGKLRTLGDSITAEFDKALTDIGTSVDQLATGISPKFKQMASGIAVLAENARATADQFREAFGQGIDGSKTVAELENITAAFTKAKERGQNLIDSGNLKEGQKWITAAGEAADMAKVKFEGVFDASLKAAKSKSDFDQLAESVKKFGAETGQTAEWVSSRMAQIGESARQSGQAVKDSAISSSLQKIGMSAEEMRGQASNAINNVVVELGKLRASAEVNSEGYSKAFNKAVGMTKTLEDLSAFKTELAAALQQGKIQWEQYQGSLKKVDVQFNELFQTQLKAAKTREDYDQLRATVQRLGSDGSISGQQMANALKQIDEAATGARASMVRLAKEAADLATAKLGVTQQEAAVLNGTLSIQQAKNNLAQAELRNKQDSSDVTRAEVVAAQAGVRAAEARLAVEKANLTVKNAQLEATKAQTELAAAQDKYDRDRTANNQALLQVAQEHVQSTQTQVSTAQAAATQAQELAVKTQAAADAAKQYSANLGTAKAVQDQQNFSVTTMIMNLSAVRDAYKRIGAGSLEAKELAEKWGDALDQNRIKSEQASIQWARSMEAFSQDLQKTKERLQEQAAQEEQNAFVAGKIRDSFAEITEQATMAANGMAGWGKATDEVARAYLEVRRQAFEAAKTATEAARSFISSSLSIHEELLQAQGKDDEAAALRFANRKQELAIQYQQLQVQIQIARVQAEAAGVSTQSLDNAQAQAAAAYERALADLDSLQALEINKTLQAREKALAEKNAELQALRQKAADASKEQAQSQDALNSQLEKEAALRRDIADLEAKRATSATRIRDAQNLVAQNAQRTASAATTTPSATGTGLGATTSLGSSSNAPQKIVLQVGGNKTTIQTADKAGLLKTLEGLKLTANRR